MNLPEDSQRQSDEDPTVKIHGDPTETSTLVRLLDDYLAELRAGRKPDRAQWLADYPHLAAQLEPALAGLEMIQSARSLPREMPVRLGDFRIIQEVGRGGMGIVYEAEQISLKRRVALKVLRYGAVADVQALQRFEREAQTVAGLHHTNIVPIFAIGSEDGTPYYAMQFIEGRSLAQIAAEQTGVREASRAEQAANWGLQAAEALEHAHDRGVIHRDIKPSNLILDPDGRIWLTDFGLAKRAEDATLSLTGALLGTPRYMSPEQASSLSRPVDHRTDIYSLGATLYELATGRPIFLADSPDKIITAILTTEPPLPRRVNPLLPRDLENIILKCLAKEARDRYDSAADLASDLRAFRENRPVKARRPSRTERAIRWVRQHRRAAALSVGSAVAGITLVLLGLLALQHHRQARLGNFTLTTTGPRLLAEVLDPNGRAALPGFPVPTPDPMSLPEGEYQIRLSASGLLSETWPLDIRRGRDQSLPVQLRSRFLWPPIDLPPNSYPETALVAAERRRDIALLLHVNNGGPQEEHVRMIDGATGRSIWPQDFVLTADSIPPSGGHKSEWTRLLRPSSSVLHEVDSRLLLPAIDLDQDQVPDLVWFSRTSPSLVAISGAHGRVLWWYRAHAEVPAPGVEPVQVDQPGPGSVVGYPVRLDVDWDGTPDLLAAFTSSGDSVRGANGEIVRTPAASWVEAISGSTGKRLWRRTLKNLWNQYTYSSNGTQKYNSLVRLVVDPQRTPPTLLVLQESELLCINATDGSDASTPISLPFQPALAPVLANLNTEANAEALVLEKNDDPSTPMYLHAMQWPEGTNLWTRPFKAPNRNEPTGPDHTRWFQITDLDGNGQAEIVLAVEGPSPVGLGPVELQVLSGLTGRPKWQVILPDSGSCRVRTLAGPDLNHDQIAELFVCWLSHGAKGEPLLRVSALSGANGQFLWTWLHPHSGTMREPDPSPPLFWWQRGRDHLPLLAVPIVNASGGQSTTCILTASRGELAYLLPEVDTAAAADLDQDGIPDLTHSSGGRLVAIQGLPPEDWVRLGMWSPAADFDRDGFTDLLNPEGVIRSGRDQSVLFHLPEPSGSISEFAAPPLPFGDLNGDAIPDLVRWEQHVRPGQHSSSTLSALSGQDGRRLWTAMDFDAGPTSSSYSAVMWFSDFPHFHWTDLDGDQQADLMVLHGRAPSGAMLSALSGRDGRVLWSLPCIHGVYRPLPSPVEEPFADLNGDRVLDPVLWVPSNPDDPANQPCHLGAFDGRNGQPLWLSTAIEAPGERRIPWPQPLARDLDGDGIPEIITITSSDYKRDLDGYRCELIVADGQSGQPRWTWSWRTGFPNFLPPLAARLAGDAGVSLCLAISEHNGSRLVCFDSRGKLTRERPFKQSRGDLPPSSRYLWRSVPFDPERGELLLFQDGNELCAWDGSRIRWTWPLQKQSSVLTTVDAKWAVLWTGKSVFGLDASTGQARWRCEILEEPNFHSSTHGLLLQLATRSPDGLPRLLFGWSDRASSRWATASRQAWPAFPDGRYR